MDHWLLAWRRDDDEVSIKSETGEGVEQTAGPSPAAGSDISRQQIEGKKIGKCFFMQRIIKLENSSGQDIRKAKKYE